MQRTLEATFTLSVDGKVVAKEHSFAVCRDDDYGDAATHVMAVVPRAFEQAFSEDSNPCSDALCDSLIGEIQRAIRVADDRGYDGELCWLRALEAFMRALSRSGEWFTDNHNWLIIRAKEMAGTTDDFRADMEEQEAKKKG